MRSQPVALVGAIGLILAGCVSATSSQQTGAEAPEYSGEFADDIRVIDRGFQAGRSRHVGWPAPKQYTVDPVFFSPWPEDFSRKQLIDSALSRAFDYFEEHAESDGASNLTLHFEDSFPENHRAWVEDLAVVSASFPAEYTTHHFDVIVGEPSYVYEVIDDLGVWTPREGHCGGLDPDGVVGGCASRGAVSANYGQTIESGELDWSGTLPSIVPHEMFHSVQDVLDPDPESGSLGWKFPRPLWFIEGGAEFFGYAVSDYAGVMSYYVSPWEWWYYLPSPDVKLIEYSERPSFAVPPEDYWKGQIAIEYIIASVGVEGVLEISKALGEGMLWDEAFEEGTGLTIGDFYTRFDRAYRNMFEANTELRTHLNRECPGQWNCLVQRGSEEFKRIDGSATYPVATRGILDDACSIEPEEFAKLTWWKDCIDPAFSLPKTPEVEFHEGSGEWADTPTYLSCEEFNLELGVAASAAAREKAGAVGTGVNTYLYAANHLFDTNADGVICSPLVPDPVR